LVRVRLADVENRADTAEFLKSQLRLRHPESAFTPDVEPVAPKESRAARMARERKAAEAMRAMAIEQAEEQRLNIVTTNNNILTLLLLANT
jgi:hypothetical protein